MKGILISVLFVLMLGCKPQVKNELISQYREIYIQEIHETLNSIEKRYLLSPQKVQPLYYKAVKIYANFQKMDSAIFFNKDDISYQLTLNNVIEAYGNEKLLRESSLKMRYDLLTIAIAKKKISRIENSLLIYELFNKLIYNLYTEIDRDDYKFNQLKAYVACNKSVVNVGETYQAFIFIAAFDTLRDPRIKFGNVNVPINNGIGDLKIISSSKGKKNYSGEVEWLMEDNGQIIKLPFEINYEVK
jgi:hypothetical protein